METLRIVFMGTPDFAVGILDKLIKHRYNIVGIITAPDRPAGRGRKLNASAIKEYAVEKGLQVLQPNNLKDETFLKRLKLLDANLQIVVAFRMLPKVVWQMPLYGTFNLHASLLPQYRGAAPINWAIINGERKTGVTTFFIDEKIDTGAIILQQEVDINPTDTAEDLHDTLMRVGASTVIKTVERIQKGNFDTIAQTNLQELRPAPKLHRETCEIHWENSLSAIFNFVRGLSPYPAAWTMLHHGDESIQAKIYKCHMEETNHHLPAGTVVHSKKEMKVAAKGGFLVLDEIQLQGKKRMPVSEVLNGLKLTENVKMG